MVDGKPKDPALVQTDPNNTYFLYALSSNSPLTNVGASMAPGGAPIVAPNNTNPTLGQWGLIFMGLLLLIVNVIELKKVKGVPGC